MEKRLAKAIVASVMVLYCALNAVSETTGTIVLSGSEPAILAITVTGEAAAANLPLTTSVTDLKVGTVVERSNKKAGYTVTISAASMMTSGATGPSLRSPLTVDSLPYTIKYGGKAVVFTGAAAAIVSNVLSKTQSAGTVNVVTVSFDGTNAFLDEAIYGDVLTFTVIAK